MQKISNSYSGSGSNWLDLSGSNNHATFYGNTSYSASDGGIFILMEMETDSILLQPLTYLLWGGL
ncbi:MAG: hypothetical protein CM15mP122_2000 [Bacteroidota bacterium]|nr:MAG: hypothetical protein CM15mP122_2000 [Bacteroidota bacterium]